MNRPYGKGAGVRRYRLNGKKLVGALVTVAALAAIVVVAGIALREAGIAASGAQSSPSGDQPGTSAVQPSAPTDTPGKSVSRGDYLIVVDAGHGGFDPGCVGVNGTHEADVNLAIAKYLKAEFEAQGMRVLMTREEDVGLGATQNESLQERGRIIREADPDLVVSIHLNSFPQDPDVSGPLALFMAGSERGKALAGAIQDALNDELNADGKERSQELYVLKQGDQPSVLVECGYLSNADEERNLLKPEYQQRVAKAIGDGVRAYLSGE